MWRRMLLRLDGSVREGERKRERTILESSILTAGAFPCALCIKCMDPSRALISVTVRSLGPVPEI